MEPQPQPSPSSWPVPRCTETPIVGVESVPLRAWRPLGEVKDLDVGWTTSTDGGEW